MLRVLAAIVLTALLIGAAGAVALVREERYPAPQVSEESLYITSGPALRRLTIGYHALAADLYWIRTIQYYGGIRLAHAKPDAPPDLPKADYRLLYPLLDLTTTLDPLFNIAYRFGAHFLAEPAPGGAGRPDLAVALLEKGLRSRPDKWEYMQDIGFVYYSAEKDYKTASEWFDRAARVPGAPWFLRSLAAVTLARGGDRRASRLMWESIRESAEIDWLRTDAERRLVQLRAMDDIDALQARVDAYTKANGHPPENWAAMRARAVPADPTGTPYELINGRVGLARQSPLFPLPDEPTGAIQPS